jgi:hypothetical protein
MYVLFQNGSPIHHQIRNEKSQSEIILKWTSESATKLSSNEFIMGLVGIITLVFCFVATMPKLKGNRGEQAKRKIPKEEVKEADYSYINNSIAELPDLRSSNSSSSSSARYSAL